MKPIDRAAWALVAMAVLLLLLTSLVPSGQKPDFFTRLAERRAQQSPGSGGPEVREPAGLPVPGRYIEATRAEVARRMAAPDWARLSRERRAEILLEILVVSGADAAYWSMPEARQRRVAAAYVRAFLDGEAAGGAAPGEAAGAGQGGQPVGNP